MKVDYGNPRIIQEPPKPAVKAYMGFVFILFIAGILLGSKIASQDYNYSTVLYEHGFLLGLRRALRFYIPIIVGIFFPIGIFIVPVVMILRGCTLCTTAMVLCRTAGWKNSLWCLIPAYIQLPALFLLSEFALITVVGRLRHKSYVGSNEHRNRFIIYLCIAVMSVLFSVMLDTSFL